MSATKKQPTSGTQTGESSAGMTEIQRGTRSTGAASQSISVMSGTTPSQNPTFQPTQNLADVPESLKLARLMISFASQLRKLGLVEPKNINLPNGDKGWAIFMPIEFWEVDPKTKELRPR